MRGPIFYFAAHCRFATFRAYAARTRTFFLLVQKEGKDTLRGRWISISPFP